MKPKARQSVKVRVSRHYGSNSDRSSITRIWLAEDAILKLALIVQQARAEGFGINARGEVELFLTNYNANLSTSNGCLGIVRTGASSRPPIDDAPKLHQLTPAERRLGGYVAASRAR